MDYAVRAYATPDQVAVAIGRAIIATDAESFKPTTYGPFGLRDAKLAGDIHSAYLKVWSALLALDDGTSSYAWQRDYVISAPDPKATAQVCVTGGHRWPRRSDPRRAVRCPDCGARKLPSGEIRYPKPKSDPIGAAVEAKQLAQQHFPELNQQNQQASGDATQPSKSKEGVK